jgi:hypothetical protein
VPKTSVVAVRWSRSSRSCASNASIRACIAAMEVWLGFFLRRRRHPLWRALRRPLRSSTLAFLRSSTLGLLRSSRLGVFGRRTPRLPVGRFSASWHVLTLPPGNLPARFRRSFCFLRTGRTKHNPSRARPIDAAADGVMNGRSVVRASNCPVASAGYNPAQGGGANAGRCS